MSTDTATNALSPAEEPLNGLSMSQAASPETDHSRSSPPEFHISSGFPSGFAPPSTPVKEMTSGLKEISAGGGGDGCTVRITCTGGGVLLAS